MGKRFLSLTAAALLSLAALLFSLLLFGCSASRFAAAQERIALLPQETAAAFSQDTLSYLCGRQTEWHAAELLSPYGYAPSEAFSTHMAEVRSGVRIARFLCGGCLAAGLLLLLCFRRKGIAPGCWVIGAALPLAVCAAAALWAAFDFEGFWYCLHKAFIPGGIFSSAEPIMALFPAELFAGYAAPVLLLYLALALLMAFAPRLFAPLRKKEREL